MGSWQLRRPITGGPEILGCRQHEQAKSKWETLGQGWKAERLGKGSLI